MPDPRDYMDDDHVFVKGHVRRKQAYTEHRRSSWFGNLDWYWRLLIFVAVFAGVIAILVLSFTENIYILFGLILFVIFLLFLRQSTK